MRAFLCVPLGVRRASTRTRRDGRSWQLHPSRRFPCLPTARRGRWSRCRFPPAALAYARTRAEMEGLALTAVLEAALDAYGSGRPGEPVGFIIKPGVE